MLWGPFEWIQNSATTRWAEHLIHWALLLTRQSCCNRPVSQNSKHLDASSISYTTYTSIEVRDVCSHTIKSQKIQKSIRTALLQSLIAEKTDPAVSDACDSYDGSPLSLLRAPATSTSSAWHSTRKHCLTKALSPSFPHMQYMSQLLCRDSGPLV